MILEVIGAIFGIAIAGACYANRKYIITTGL